MGCPGLKSSYREKGLLKLVLTTGKRSWLIFQYGKVFIEMQLTYLIDIFEDNYNIVRDRFETDSGNVMKNTPLVAKKQRKSQYILAWLSPSENLENYHQEQQHSKRSQAILVCDKVLRNLVIWKSIGLMLLVIYNDVICNF